MGAVLEILWQRLETNFPLAGARRHLQCDLGIEIVAVLEQTGILQQRRLADTYPCPGPRGEGCPRQVIEIDGARRIRVRVGPFAAREEAEKAAGTLKAAGLPAAVLTL